MTAQSESIEEYADCSTGCENDTTTLQSAYTIRRSRGRTKDTSFTQMLT